MFEGKETPLVWMASSKRAVRGFPEDVKHEVGHALDIAQRGGKATSAKPLRGFQGASVLEIVEDGADGNTYRAVYTVKFRRLMHVLHAFEKKSTIGIKTQK